MRPFQTLMIKVIIHQLQLTTFMLINRATLVVFQFIAAKMNNILNHPFRLFPQFLWIFTFLLKSKLCAITFSFFIEPKAMLSHKLLQLELTQRTECTSAQDKATKCISMPPVSLFSPFFVISLSLLQFHSFLQLPSVTYKSIQVNCCTLSLGCLGSETKYQIRELT